MASKAESLIKSLESLDISFLGKYEKAQREIDKALTLAAQEATKAAMIAQYRDRNDEAEAAYKKAYASGAEAMRERLIEIALYHSGPATQLVEKMNALLPPSAEKENERE